MAGTVQGQWWQWLKGWVARLPRATTTGGALNHAPPVNSNAGEETNRSGSSLQPPAGGGLPATCKTTRTANKTQTTKIKNLFGPQICPSSRFLLLLLLLSSSFSRRRGYSKMTCKQEERKHTNTTQRHKNIICLDLFKSRLCSR